MAAKEKAEVARAGAGRATRRSRKLEEGASLPEGHAPVVSKKRKPTLRECQELTKAGLAEAWPEISDGFMKQAKEGSLNHAKFMVEFSGMKEDMAKPRRAGKRFSLARLLKAELDKSMAREAATAADGEAAAEDGFHE